MYIEEEKNLNEYLKVDNSSVHGNGLFAVRDIPEGTFISLIYGEFIDENECVRREDDEKNEYIFWHSDNNYIDVSNNQLRYLNHDCSPNCYVEETDDGRLCLISEKHIYAGEEITIDYDYEDVIEFCGCNKCQVKKGNTI